MSDKPSGTYVRGGRKVALKPPTKTRNRATKKIPPRLPHAALPGYGPRTDRIELLVLRLFDPMQRERFQAAVLEHAAARDRGHAGGSIGPCGAIRDALLPFLEQMLYLMPVNPEGGDTSASVEADAAQAGGTTLDLAKRRLAKCREEAVAACQAYHEARSRGAAIAVQRRASERHLRALRDREEALEAVQWLEPRCIAREWGEAWDAVSRFVFAARVAATKLERAETCEGGFVALVEPLMREWDACAPAVMRPLVCTAFAHGSARRKANVHERRETLKRYMAENGLSELPSEHLPGLQDRLGTGERNLFRDLEWLRDDSRAKGEPWPPRA